MDAFWTVFSLGDVLALGVFIICWFGFEILLDHSSLRYRSLTGLMAHSRREWMLVMADREMRMVDTAILSSLQQGAAYFGTVSILAIGACLAGLGSTDEALRVFRDLPGVEAGSRALLELKLGVLTLVFVYAFFKFGWSYRLFNYCSILLGAVQQPEDADQKTRRRQALKAGEINILASHHFTAGQRAIFMALALLGWFISPLALVISTLFVLVVLVRRQFFSKSRMVLLEDKNMNTG